MVLVRVGVAVGIVLAPMTMGKSMRVASAQTDDLVILYAK